MQHTKIMIRITLVLITAAVLQVTAAPATPINANILPPAHAALTVFHDTIETFERIKPIAPILVNSPCIPAERFLKPKIKSPRRGLFWQTIKTGEFWRIFGYLSLIAAAAAALVGLIGWGIAALFKAAISSVFWICFGVAGALFVLIAFGIAFLAMNIA
jgi:hypothetical protein